MTTKIQMINSFVEIEILKQITKLNSIFLLIFLLETYIIDFPTEHLCACHMKQYQQRINVFNFERFKLFPNSKSLSNVIQCFVMKFIQKQMLKSYLFIHNLFPYDLLLINLLNQIYIID